MITLIDIKGQSLFLYRALESLGLITVQLQLIRLLISETGIGKNRKFLIWWVFSLKLLILEEIFVKT